MFIETQKMRKAFGEFLLKIHTQKTNHIKSTSEGFLYTVLSYKHLFMAHLFILLISWSLDPQTVALMVDLCGSHTKIMAYFIRVSVIMGHLSGSVCWASESQFRLSLCSQGCEIKARVGLRAQRRVTWDSLPLPLSLYPFSLSQNKVF